MKTIMAKSPHDSSFSFSRRYFHWKKKPELYEDLYQQDHDDDGQQILTLNPSSPEENTGTGKQQFTIRRTVSSDPPNKKHSVGSVSKLRSALSLTGLGKTRSQYNSGRFIGTIFGHRRGHVHFAIQTEPNSKPTFLIELAMPTSVLVREMASGLARIALECERHEKMTIKKQKQKQKQEKKKLMEEMIWRTYCNGKKYGSANRFDCGDEEWRILKAVGPITVGAGVLPTESKEKGFENEGEDEGEVMYIRARFERVVGSRDSEAFYMMNPHGVGGFSELSIFLLRV